MDDASRQTLAQLLNEREGGHTLAQQLNERSREGGEIAWLNQERRYGFIKQDRRDADLFFHHSALELPANHQVKFGDRVSYEVAVDRRPGRDPRFCAKAVRLVNGGDQLTSQAKVRYARRCAAEVKTTSVRGRRLPQRDYV